MRRVRAFLAQPLFVVACFFAAVACVFAHATNTVAGRQVI